MICKQILLITFLNEPKFIFFGTQLNSFMYFYRSNATIPSPKGRRNNGNERAFHIAPNL